MPTPEMWQRLENDLTRSDVDFAGRLVAVNALADRISENGVQVRKTSVAALAAVLLDDRHRKETQSYFLYRAAADALAGAAAGCGDAADCEAAAIDALATAADKGRRHVRRASAEALGSLPLLLCGPDIESPACDAPPQYTWRALFRLAGISPCRPAAVKGRSRVFAAGSGRVFVVKTAGSVREGGRLALEAAWMERLGRLDAWFPGRFDVPRPLETAGGHLFLLPAERKNGGAAPLPAIGFHAAADYFRYPNRPGVARPEFAEMLGRSALLLGRLASMGIVHTAPIPLFHNRAQAGRRQDRGLYEWPRGGRLDRWLASSRHPNFGAAGLRDFEHLSSVRGGGKQRYVQIGTQLLSLVLVAGSYFRQQAPNRLGIDERGRPVDARDLFDPALFKEALRIAADRYGEGFAGAPPGQELQVDLDRLTGRLIEEMGVDRHMEEILRAADQQRMSDRAFCEALADGRCPKQRIETVKKGAEDISLMTGPHLGAFNGRISVPELVDFLQKTAAACVLGAYRKQRRAACRGHGLHC